MEQQIINYQQQIKLLIRITSHNSCIDKGNNNCNISGIDNRTDNGNSNGFDNGKQN